MRVEDRKLERGKEKEGKRKWIWEEREKEESRGVKIIHGKNHRNAIALNPKVFGSTLT